jgi:ribosome biogenesis GTPase
MRILEEIMVTGKIIKGIAGFYYVHTHDGVYECKARGKFKKEKVTPLVGDNVKISIDDPDEMKGIVEEILPRKVTLVRPAVANIDQVIIVFALKNPDPNIMLLDKLLVISEYYGIEPILVFNKWDLDSDNDFEKYQSIYEETGYKVVKACAKQGIGIEEVVELLKGKISVFAGPSGVGKSSMLNRIKPGIGLKTGEVSEKIKRGKHTTRHSELISLDGGGWVVDTPGFTSLDISFLEVDEIRDLFPEFSYHSENCRFIDCIHINEPGCGVLSALENEIISESRYTSYKYFIDNLKNNRRNKSW